MDTTSISMVKAATTNVAHVVKAHAPEILTAAGIVGTVATVVLSSKATLKAKDVLEETKHDLESIRIAEDSPNISKEAYSDEDAAQDKIMVYANAAKKLACLYGPAVMAGTAAIGCFLMSNRILSERSAAIAVAYGVLDTTFKQYRERVVEQFGEDTDRRLRYGLKAEKITEKTVGEDGKTSKKKTEIDVLPQSDEGPSCYARYFDACSREWTKNAEYNIMFLNAVQNSANDKLVANGVLFLNEVYEMLGFDKTRAGQVVGWRYRPYDENHVGDNYVDFGIYDCFRYSEDKARFVNGYENVVILDFNVDGVILDYMPDNKSSILDYMPDNKSSRYSARRLTGHEADSEKE